MTAEISVFFFFLSFVPFSFLFFFLTSPCNGWLQKVSVFFFFHSFFRSFFFFNQSISHILIRLHAIMNSPKSARLCVQPHMSVGRVGSALPQLKTDPLSGTVVRQTDFDVIIGQCVVSDRNLACAILFRHVTCGMMTCEMNNLEIAWSLCSALTWFDWAQSTTN